MSIFQLSQAALLSSFHQAALYSFFNNSGWNPLYGRDSLMVLNNLSYCGFHARDICHECSRDYAQSNGEYGDGFELPEDGRPEYPMMLNDIKNSEYRKLIGQRWLDMQKTIYSAGSSPQKGNLIRLPVSKNSDEANLSGVTLQKRLLHLFHQVQGMTSSQRYYLGNQSRILIQDYDTFMEAACLYDEELVDMTARMNQLYDMSGMRPGGKEMQDLAKANALSKFGFFLELNTHRTFWRTMELTADAFVMHTEHYKEEADGHVVFTEKAIMYLLQWLSQILWSVQHAQFRLNSLRGLQHEVYQRGDFPFYPAHIPALKADRDVHLIIAKLSKAKLHDLPSLAALFTDLREASDFAEQMKGVNAEVMAAIDELSTRFRVMEKVMSAVLHVASEEDVKNALKSFKFMPESKDVNSKVDDVLSIITKMHEGLNRQPSPKKRSYLHKLIVKENSYRQAHAARFMCYPYTRITHNAFTKKIFDEFKSIYTVLYRDSIRKQWKQDEYSLLPPDVARRFQHRLDVQKKEKRKSAATITTYEQADLAEARSVPDSAFIDPSLLWEVGDGTGEKYVPPVVREKVKTRKQISKTEDSSAESATDESCSQVEETLPQEAEIATEWSLDRLKKDDVITRDLLWRKIKGTLKWSDLVQFLTRLGCHLIAQDGSKRKFIDPLSGRWTLLHRPHPGDECRADQRESYRIHVEDWLNIKYSDLSALDEVWQTK
ncbi:hypothetical protein Mapa_006348 [Marchantia paleacea]|nr:hypothetical protein Mapa_006348 [Marchantia paleacea]